MVISKLFSVTFAFTHLGLLQNKMFPKQHPTDCKIAMCFPSFTNSGNAHSLKGFKVDVLHTKPHPIFTALSKGMVIIVSQ